MRGGLPSTRYKMSSDIHQPPSPRSRASPPRAHAPSFISPSLIRKLSSPVPAAYLSSPTRFTQNTFLSFIFFPSGFLFLPPRLFPPPSSLRLFWTFSLRPSLNIPPPAAPSPPPPLSLPPRVMNESVCWVQFIFTEQGSAHCQSPLALHVSIPSLKRQRVQGVTAG